ncbi:MAG: alpha/beta hydrolase [Desulfobacteraceae bacterium]|nr:alpha/beta hydrolase [Desulfobacteraceae bacterium]
MSTININSIKIAYEAFGKHANPSVILIAGLGEQMVSWPIEFCQKLSNEGFYVIRFDNRDTGLSTTFDKKGIPDLQKAWEAYFTSSPITPPYSLEDMASDVNGLLEALNIDKAYVFGHSMGGMVAQNMAFKYPERMAGMVCIGSSTGDLTLPPPKPEVQTVMADPPPDSREKFIAHSVLVFKVFSNGSTGYDAECRAKIAEQTYDRNYYPIGFMRHSVAMLADGSRTERLKEISVPTLVIQGEIDPLAQPAHGQAIAGAVQNSKFIQIPNLGHGMDYPELWPIIINHFLNFLDEN